MVARPPDSDVESIVEASRGIIQDLEGASLFITGGTGFFGTWLLHSLSAANHKLKLGLRATVLTRDPNAFTTRFPELGQDPTFRFCQGSIENFEFPEGKFTHLIHGATTASVKLNEESQRKMFDTILNGTRRTLEFTVKKGVQKYLLISSGAVYGRQIPQVSHVSEDYLGGPDVFHASAAYAEGKRAAEFLCAAFHREFGIETTIARCFAFVGPYLPLDTHFAIGNFIRDALSGSSIVIQGDGTPYRSYLYASDLIVWLVAILLRGKSCRPYNVGSQQAISIAEVAREVAASSALPQSLGKHDIIVKQAASDGKLAERYVPSVERAKTELGLQQTVSLKDAIAKTISWHLQQR